jgi:hypothetical protein
VGSFRNGASVKSTQNRVSDLPERFCVGLIGFVFPKTWVYDPTATHFFHWVVKESRERGAGAGGKSILYISPRAALFCADFFEKPSPWVGNEEKNFILAQVALSILRKKGQRASYERCVVVGVISCTCGRALKNRVSRGSSAA